MATASHRRRRAWRRPLVRRIPELAAAVLAIAAYAAYLNHQDERVRHEFARARTESPENYLEQVRVVQGFDAFLTAYSEVFGSEHFLEAPPGFLLGRWTVFDHELRVGDHYSASFCENPMSIGDGRLSKPGAEVPTRSEYRLHNDRMLVRTADGDVFEMLLVSSGVNLHHLEIDDQIVEGRAYLYRCD